MSLYNFFFAMLAGAGAAKRHPKKVAAAIVVATGAATSMHPAVLDATKAFEGYVGHVYRDAVGVPTIGYGHTRRAGTENFSDDAKWTKAYATRVLDKDMTMFRAGVLKATTVQLTKCQLSVLTMFAYNVGVGAYRSSTLRRRLNKGEYDAVPHELMKWRFASGKELRGLTRRRRAEGKLWSTNCQIKVK